MAVLYANEIRFHAAISSATEAPTRSGRATNASAVLLAKGASPVIVATIAAIRQKVVFQPLRQRCLGIFAADLRLLSATFASSVFAKTNLDVGEKRCYIDQLCIIASLLACSIACICAASAVLAVTSHSHQMFCQALRHAGGRGDRQQIPWAPSECQS